jgi:hypothetical protein
VEKSTARCGPRLAERELELADRARSPEAKRLLSRANEVLKSAATAHHDDGWVEGDRHGAVRGPDLVGALCTPRDRKGMAVRFKAERRTGAVNRVSPMLITAADRMSTGVGTRTVS